MFAKSIFTILPLFSAISTLVSADVVPTSPDASTVVRVGATAEALWTKDSNGNWTDVTIKLMTGDNFNMIEVATLAENVDGTSTTSLEWTVPEVSPTSKIYFLQFSADPTTTPQWTTRFTIAGADGSTTDPTNSTQPGGASIPWGTGMLIGGNSTVSTSSSSNATSAVTSSSSSMVSSTSSSSSSSATASASMTTSVRAAAAASESASSVASSASRSASNSAAPASTAATSGASSVQIAGGLVAFVGFVAGFMVI